ncbi:hypothetical protein GOODEAATRI_034533 [Goodea atripinnis]|uniref:Uncharacterized protein n=1 Tax=Goodea atripinnis TaxID=208336 RepID=A0ABV0Q3F6_9TELE
MMITPGDVTVRDQSVSVRFCILCCFSEHTLACSQTYISFDRKGFQNCNLSDVFMFQLQCCGKGLGTTVLSVIISKFSSQDICSSNWLTVVSDVAHISNSFVFSVKKQVVGQSFTNSSCCDY